MNGLQNALKLIVDSRFRITGSQYLFALESWWMKACIVANSARASGLYNFNRVVWYFEEGGVVLWRGRCGTLKRAVWYFEEDGLVLWRGWRGTLKRVDESMFLVLFYMIFQGMNFSALISVVALEMSLIPARLRLELQSFQSDVQDFAEEGSKLLAYYSHSTNNALHVCLRGCCGTLNRVMWYFVWLVAVLWRGWCGTLKMVMWYFEEGGVVLWRGWYGTSRRVAWCYVLLRWLLQFICKLFWACLSHYLFLFHSCLVWFIFPFY